MSVSTTKRQMKDRGDAADLQTDPKPCHFIAKRQGSLLNLCDIYPKEQTRDATSLYLSVPQDGAVLSETFPVPIRSYDQREALMPCKYRCGGCRFCSLHKVCALSDMPSAVSHLVQIRERNRAYQAMDGRFASKLTVLGRKCLEINPKRRSVHGCYLGGLYEARGHNKVMWLRLCKRFRNLDLDSVPRKLTQ